VRGDGAGLLVHAALANRRQGRPGHGAGAPVENPAIPRTNNGAPPMRTVRNFSVRLARIRFFPWAPPAYRWRVSAYEDLDAFKACHQAGPVARGRESGRNRLGRRA